MSWLDMYVLLNILRAIKDALKMLLTDVRVSAFTFIFLNYPYNGFFVSNVFC